MTELAVLERRRELILLSASLQRATISRRIAAFEAHPAQSVISFVVSLVRKPMAARLGLAAAAMLWRSIRKRRKP